MSEIKYKFAICNGEIKHIEKFNKDKCQNAICPQCGQELIAKKGEKNTHHFSHKVDTNCSYESYLHKTAKKLIYDKLKNGKDLKIEIETMDIKSYENKFKKINDKLNQLNNDLKNTFNEDGFQEYQKRKFFNQEEKNKILEDLIKNDEKFISKIDFNIGKKAKNVELEKSISIFKPDILLTTNDNELIFIEIAVTHKISDEKKKVNLPILEIYIKNEEDIENINNGEIKKFQLINYPKTEISTYLGYYANR